MQHKGGFGSKSYQPRNERAIILECCLKVAADVRVTAWASPLVSRAEYQVIMAEITTEAIKAAKELCKEAGVQ